MTNFSQKLSAYLDGELDPATTAEIEAILAQDPVAVAQLDALIQANEFAQETFAKELDAPVPFGLAQMIKTADLTVEEPARTQRPNRVGWGAVAACVAFFGLGGFGGYVLHEQVALPVQTAGWLAEIANYHAVYAGQQRHLVEVGADESDHIQTWLGNTINVQFSIPDLTDQGLTFEGARLVVANGKPVAQLMYTMADGTVIALCLQQSNKDPSLEPVFNERTIKGFDFVSWSEGGADYVVIGPEGQAGLRTIAQTAATDV